MYTHMWECANILSLFYNIIHFSPFYLRSTFCCFRSLLAFYLIFFDFAMLTETSNTWAAPAMASLPQHVCSICRIRFIIIYPVSPSYSLLFPVTSFQARFILAACVFLSYSSLLLLLLLILPHFTCFVSLFTFVHFSLQFYSISNVNMCGVIQYVVKCV